MQAVQVGINTAMILLDEDAETLLAQLQDPCNCKKAVAFLLRVAGLAEDSTVTEIRWYEKEGKNLLFLSYEEGSQGVLFRFANADQLIDAVRLLRPYIKTPERSTLMVYKDGLYLSLMPPYGLSPEALSEFAQVQPASTLLSAHLKEHGQVLSAPCALTELAKKV